MASNLVDVRAVAWYLSSTLCKYHRNVFRPSGLKENMRFMIGRLRSMRFIDIKCGIFVQHEFSLSFFEPISVIC